MPLVFIVLGILFLVVSIRGTQGELWDLLKSEFQGQNGFVVWASAILILGFIGYWKRIRPVSDAGIGLIFLVLILSNGGFFAKFNQAIRNPSAAAVTAAQSYYPNIPGGAQSAILGGVPLTQGQASAQTPETAPGGVPAPSPAIPLLPGSL